LWAVIRMFDAARISACICLYLFMKGFVLGN
jgi:hypothetical protein